MPACGLAKRGLPSWKGGLANRIPFAVGGRILHDCGCLACRQLV